MICKNCGNENDDSYLFCASCGSPLTVQASQQHVPEAPAETAETAAVKETAETPERAETAETEEKQKPVPADSAQPPASAEAADSAVEVQNHEHASKETPEPAEAAAAGAAEDQPIQAAAVGAAEATPVEAVPPASYQQQQIPQQPFAPYQPQQYQSQYQPQYQSPYQVPYQPRYQPVYPAYQQSPMPYQYGYPAAMVPGYMPKPKATVEKRNKYFIPAFIFGLIAVVFFILNLIERINYLSTLPSGDYPWEKIKAQDLLHQGLYAVFGTIFLILMIIAFFKGLSMTKLPVILMALCFTLSFSELYLLLYGEIETFTQTWETYYSFTHTMFYTILLSLLPILAAVFYTITASGVKAAKTPALISISMLLMVSVPPALMVIESRLSGKLGFFSPTFFHNAAPCFFFLSLLFLTLSVKCKAPEAKAEQKAEAIQN